MQMRQTGIEPALSGLLVLGVLCMNAVAQSELPALNSPPPNAANPLVLGHGVGLFKVGPLLAQDDFENLENWVVQIQQRSGFKPAHVEARDHSLDCLVPGRGCTVWFKKKLPTRVTIVYNVLCPTPTFVTSRRLGNQNGSSPARRMAAGSWS